MPFIKLTDKIKELDGLIVSCKTGPASELADALSVSPGVLLSLLDKLRSEGSAISYCDKRLTYYYKKRVPLHEGMLGAKPRGRLSANPYPSAAQRRSCAIQPSYWTDGQLA